MNHIRLSEVSNQPDLMQKVDPKSSCCTWASEK